MGLRQTFQWLSVRLLPFAVASIMLSARVWADEPADEFFETRVRPLLLERCFECHSTGSKSLMAGLKLDSKSGLLAGGASGPVVVPGDASRSLLIKVLHAGESGSSSRPEHRLPNPAIEDLEKWVNGGAAFPTAAPDGKATYSPVTNSETSHWAFQPIQAITPPTSAGVLPGGGNSIDRFIQAQQAAHGLTSAPEANRRNLIRRATFDLTGLPPAPSEVESFVADTLPEAYARLIQRLLASPHYGERWGRWWLDVARYADTNGQDENKVMANAWRYRDWVIGAFSRDLPFNEFTVQQIAGDLLPTEGVPERELFDRWTATGFLVLGPKMLAEQDKPKLVMDLIDEQIDVVSRAFLGLTVGCARCHDHKFDPIAARDYYALAGIFKSTRTMANLEFVSKFNERCVSTRSELSAIEAYGKALAVKTNQLATAIRKANADLVDVRRHDFPRYVTAVVNSGHSELSTNHELDADLLKRFESLLGPPVATNPIAITLREIAGSSSNSAEFLREYSSDSPPTTGMKLVPGKVGAAFAATGNNYLEIAHSKAIDPPLLTAEVWVQAGEFPREGDTRRWLLNKNGNEWVEGHYALLIEKDRAGAYLNIGGGRDNVFALWSGDHSLKPGQWHHVAMTYDGSAFCLYLDGQKSGETTIGRPRISGTNSLALGRRQDGYIYFKGRLDEARVFDRALSAAELKSHFASPATPVDGAVARWEFNDLSPTELQSFARADAADALFGAGGVLALPSDPRLHYPPATKEAIAAMERERDALVASAPQPAAFALAVVDDKPVDLPVHIRGSHLNLAKDPVPRGFIRAAYHGEPSAMPADHSGRLELARWLSSPANPLTARVIVNRLWQAHFGEGLVRTSDNFGVRGDLPTHPELLDWLAGEFIRSGWSVKSMHRLIMSSATYRQATAESGPGDPDNRWLSHFPRQRLEAEMIRDSLLAVSGRLDRAQGGSLVPWKNDEYAPEDKVSASSGRRTVYLPIVRDRVYDALTIFDFANPSVGTSKRVPTVVSHQALFFLNSPLVKSSARALAQSLLEMESIGERGRIGLAYLQIFDRPPSADETERVIRFLDSTKNSEAKDPNLAAWTALCQTLFAANEFIYRD